MVCLSARHPAIAVLLRFVQFTSPKRSERPMPLTLIKNEGTGDVDDPVAIDVRANAPAGFEDALAEVSGFWAPLPDKPEETAEGVARALWLAAADMPISVERAAGAALPALDSAASERLRG